MKNILETIKREALHIFPAVLYFFIAFNLFRLTFGKMFAHLGMNPPTLLATLVSSAIVGKVILVTDHLPLLKAFSRRPLIFNMIWRTSIYFIFCYILRVVEHLLPLVRQYGNVGVAWRHLVDAVWWPQFWTVQTWYLILLFIFVIGQETVRNVGKENLNRIFFGPR